MKKFRFFLSLLALLAISFFGVAQVPDQTPSSTDFEYGEHDTSVGFEADHCTRNAVYDFSVCDVADSDSENFYSTGYLADTDLADNDIALNQPYLLHIEFTTSCLFGSRYLCTYDAKNQLYIRSQNVLIFPAFDFLC